MVDDVHQRGGERQRRGPVKPVGPEGERQPKSDEDDADVLDGAVGEELLEILLHHGIEHADERRAAADGEHDHGPPPFRLAEEVEHDPHEAVDRDLGHNAAHQRRDVARRRRVRERQPDVQRHEAGLRSGAEENKHQDQPGERPRLPSGLDVGEGVAPVRPGKEREGEKETQGPEARHDEVDVAGAQVLRLLVMRHDERPGGERHELPGEEEGEGVVGEDDEVHAGEERREERQDAHRRRFVLAMAERIEARRGAAEIDDGEKRSRERIEAEVRADPGQAERQCEPLGRCLHLRKHCAERNERHREAGTVNEPRARRPAAGEKRQAGDGDEGRDAAEGQRHLPRLCRDLLRRLPMRRTPRPPPSLTASSPMSSTPTPASAATSFMSELTLPRITSSLASMRWIVGTDRPDSSASFRWSIRRRARAARNCAEVITCTPRLLRRCACLLQFHISLLMCYVSGA